MPKKVGKYEIHKTLGEGTFGKVKRALNTESQEWVAIKVLDKEKIQKQNMGAQVKKEISIMKLIRHPHVVSLKEVLASRTKIFIVLELVTGGELFDKIVAAGRFKEDISRFYFQQLVVGTQYCHAQGVCHRDLKPENLLLDDKQNLKISDFGLSSLFEQVVGESDRQTLLHTTCGTPNYVAPEVLADKGYDGAAADTWSIGVILFVFLAGFLPFDEPTMTALFRKIQKGDFTYPNWFTDDAKDLLNHILVVNPKNRWNLAQVKQHSWWKAGGPYASEAAEAEATKAAIEAKEVEDAEQTAAANALEEDMSVDTPRQDASSASASGNGNNGDGNNSKADSKDVVMDDVAENPSGDGEDEEGTKMNAFHLINMCSGSAIGRLFQTEEEKKIHKTAMIASSKSPSEILQILGTTFEGIQGFVSQNTYKDNSKARAVFDLGKGHVHLKVAVKTASDNPLVSIIIFKRARGDLISFGKVWEELAPKLDQLKDSTATASAAATATAATATTTATSASS